MTDIVTLIVLLGQSGLNRLWLGLEEVSVDKVIHRK